MDGMNDNTQIQTAEMRKAAELAGGQVEISRKFGIASPTVNQWVKGVTYVPVQYAVALEKWFPEHLSRLRLRPHDAHKIWPEMVEQLMDCNTFNGK